ncbi:MAG: FAD-dependent oxidoreductase [Phyllobacterium sp.]
MPDFDVIVIGAGPAGLSAAAQAARHGLTVQIVEQRATIGGAIHRQPIEGATPVAVSTTAANRFEALKAGISNPLVKIRFSSVFSGIDGQGQVLIDDRIARRMDYVHAKAVIVATGAVEAVRPVPGWELPGVSTAGGIQVMMKETGSPPVGQVLLAGSGPLLIALAAQMIRLGKPPVAIVESGDPLRRISASAGLVRFPELLFDALSYLATVAFSRVPWFRSAELLNIERANGKLCAVVRTAKGPREFLVDRIGLHNGIRENAIGLPTAESIARQANPAMPIILKAGDCREALGVLAAAADGARAGAEAARAIKGSADQNPSFRRAVDRQRTAQALLARVFAPIRPLRPLSQLPDETILCRCERRSIGDLKAIVGRDDVLSGREVKHNGRFAMGLCQGRFCADNAANLMAELKPEMQAPAVADLTGCRWPVRPIAIQSILNAAPAFNDNTNEVQP